MAGADVNVHLRDVGVCVCEDASKWPAVAIHVHGSNSGRQWTSRGCFVKALSCPCQLFACGCGRNATWKPEPPAFLCVPSPLRCLNFLCMGQYCYRNRTFITYRLFCNGSGNYFLVSVVKNIWKWPFSCESRQNVLMGGSGRAPHGVMSVSSSLACRTRVNLDWIFTFWLLVVWFHLKSGDGLFGVLIFPDSPCVQFCDGVAHQCMGGLAHQWDDMSLGGTPMECVWLSLLFGWCPAGRWHLKGRGVTEPSTRWGQTTVCSSNIGVFLSFGSEWKFLTCTWHTTEQQVDLRSK